MFKCLKKKKAINSEATRQPCLVDRGEKGPGMCAVLGTPSNTVFSQESQGSCQPPHRSCSSCPDSECPPLRRHKDEPLCRWSECGGYGQRPAQGGSSQWKELVEGLEKYLCPKEGGSQWRNGAPDEIFQPETTRFGLVPQASYPDGYLGASYKYRPLPPAPEIMYFQPGFWRFLSSWEQMSSGT